MQNWPISEVEPEAFGVYVHTETHWLPRDCLKDDINILSLGVDVGPGHGPLSGWTHKFQMYKYA